MNSKEYWIKRAELTILYGENNILEYEQQLKSAYASAIINVEKEINAFYQKYADKNELTIADAKTKLNPQQLKAFKQQQQIYLQEVERLGPAIFSEKYRKYIKDLSAKAYITKLSEIQANIRGEVEKAFATTVTVMDTALGEAYEDGYYRSMFDIQQQAKIGFDFTKVGGEQLNAAAKTKWLGDNYSDRIWANKEKLITALNQLIPQEFVRGRSARETAEDLGKRLDVSYKNAVRLIRTEFNYVSNKGTIDSYKECGIVDRYEYVATLDSRTSDICRDMDGKVIELKDAQTGINLPPLHPYCRSTTIPYFEDDDIGPLIEKRIARDKKGKSYILPENVTFRQWTDIYASAAYAKRQSSIAGSFNYFTTDTSKRTDNNSLGKYTNEDGTLIPEREARHKKIIDDIFKGYTPTNGTPTFTMMGGGPATGKSHMTKTGAVKLPENALLVDSDFIKTRLPDYVKMVEKGDASAAMYAHEESSALAKRIMKIANNGNYNYTLDGTGDGSVKSLTKKITDAKAASFKVVGAYATCDIDVAVERATKRAAETGRDVPLQTIYSIHKNVSQILPECAHLFDKVELYDTNNKIQLIATAEDGSGLAAIMGKEKELEKFLAKGR